VYSDTAVTTGQPQNSQNIGGDNGDLADCEQPVEGLLVLISWSTVDQQLKGATLQNHPSKYLLVLFRVTYILENV